MVDDQRDCRPRHPPRARALLELPFGVYHVAAAGDCTADFAEAIFEEARSTAASAGSRPPSTAPKAPRPAYSAAPRKELEPSLEGRAARVHRTHGRVPSVGAFTSPGQFIAPAASAVSPRPAKRSSSSTTDVLRESATRGAEHVFSEVHCQPMKWRPRRAARRSSALPPRPTSTARSGRDGLRRARVHGNQVLLEYVRGGDPLSGLDGRGLRRYRKASRRSTDPVRPSAHTTSPRQQEIWIPAYVRTFGVNASITRGANTRSHLLPEKMIPLSDRECSGGGASGLRGREAEARVASCLEDHCAGIELVMRGEPVEIHNIGGQARTWTSSAGFST